MLYPYATAPAAVANLPFGLGLGLGASAFTPLSLSPALWLRADAGTLQTVGGTAAAADADPVGDQLDQSANHNDATQATSTKRPALKLAVANGRPMLMPDAVDDVLVLTSALSLTGAFTAYAVGTRATGTNWIPLGKNATTSGALLLFNDNRAYFINDPGTAISAPYTGAAGTVITRLRRDASNVCKVASTGMAEATVGTLAGTLTLDTVYARPSGAQFNGGTNKHGELIAVASDLPTANAAGDAACVAYLQSRWGVTLP